MSHRTLQTRGLPDIAKHLQIYIIYNKILFSITGLVGLFRPNVNLNSQALLKFLYVTVHLRVKINITSTQLRRYT